LGGWFLEEWNEGTQEIITKAARFSNACISPMAAFFGGITAQEVVKYTGKFTPCTQFFHFDQFLSMPKVEVNWELTESRYDDQISIYGQEVQEKLGNLNLFMVGAGALGCEFVKAFALMGIACGPEGKITCTDNDNIEVSNLNRQFLFWKSNVGQPKSTTALSIGQSINSDLKYTALQEYVCPETETVFNDEFWDNLSFVVNAVDNVKARQYVDSKCVFHKKALLESGTLGTKANTQ
jgi:ubiquitin-activating enzyme E1